ncbi:hypothetical protein P3T76_010136 [Phytophthora citrophthora]|uniref:Uncharacterized protein n=1 Tax=Phytophthora citrophthora TaxID=4793 RepID=A0AAD9GDU5_9STRA|nr:hypothetical protein P3T76_010136 [Phytophthora citrophthora]
MRSLIPGNSQRVRQTAPNVFGKFVEAEQYTKQEICELVGSDPSGEKLYVVLDKFAMHLAFRETTKGALLSKNPVASYFGNVKNDLLELYLSLEAVSGRRLHNIASVLDKYCSKRDTDFTHQAPPCTKNDLRVLSTTLLKHAAVPEDYKDYALLNLLWYLLGRSSDTLCLMKNQVAVYPGEY